MKSRRASGILLHPTSLPGEAGRAGSGAVAGEAGDGGCGDFGTEALHFIDWLAAAGQRYWQVLPLTPPGPGHSPYMSASTHAGNPVLISIERLVSAGLLDAEGIAADDARAGGSGAGSGWGTGAGPGNGSRTGSGAGAGDDPGPGGDQSRAANRPSPARFAALERVEARKLRLLRRAADRFFGDDPALDDARAAFRQWSAAQVGWLDDYALFQAVDAAEGRRSWSQWPAPLARREPAAIAAARREHEAECRYWSFVQWIFDTQWQAVRAYARERGVAIIGDLPIYCASHSADVWVNPGLFELDERLEPAVVAGVPPDYFSATGQLWGNPLYRWSAHAEEHYAWWIARMRSALRHADVVRIDHFRGFAGYWEVPATAATAIDGQWRPGPGIALFDAMRAALGELPIIAEDLGTITDDVIALRDDLGLPGMAVLQFAFGGGPDNAYLPHNLQRNCVIYTGTHDNDTSRGWFATAPDAERRATQVYLKTDGSEIQWDLIHAASSSVAALAIYPMQDVLGLDSDARMNVPGRGDVQWRWRFTWDQVAPWQAERLALIGKAHGRRER